MSAGLFLLLTAVPVLAADTGEGERLFQATCFACHTIGGGPLVGPDLQGVTALRDREWLIRWIVEPDRVLAEGDPIATALVEEYGIPMPNLGITPQQAGAILDFLEARGEPVAAAPGGAEAPERVASTAPASPPAAPAPAGDSFAGKEYFTGLRPFENGGPACMACHTAGGIGGLGGGAVGPDLTQAVDRYGGEKGLASVLASIPFPTMSPIFSGRPLTPEEQADLVAFLTEARQASRPPGSVLMLGSLGVAGLLVLLAIFHLTWRRRLRGIRRTLVGGSRR